MVIAQILRETTDLAVQTLTGMLFWIIIGAATVLCFLSGPFGTLEAFPNGFRLIYWALSVTLTGLLGVWAHALVRSRGWTGWLSVLIVSGVFGLCASGVIVLLNLTMLSPIQNAPSILETVGYSFPTAAVIFFVLVFVDAVTSQVSTFPQNEVPALMKRLEKHGDAQQILALCAQDHYVEVITDKGSEFCLLRLNDAIAEAAPQKGFQIHRSHWVAKTAIKSAEFKGPSPHVTLADGRSLNISQSRLKKFEEFLRPAFRN